jgi:hypothetical protein
VGKDVHLDCRPHLASTKFMHSTDHARMRNSKRQNGCMLDMHGLPCGWAIAGYAERCLQVLNEELHLFKFTVNKNCSSWLHLMHEVYDSFGICVRAECQLVLHLRHVESVSWSPLLSNGECFSVAHITNSNLRDETYQIAHLSPDSAIQTLRSVNTRSLRGEGPRTKRAGNVLGPIFIYWPTWFPGKHPNAFLLFRNTVQCRVRYELP